MTALPQEAEKLLAAEPSEFVERRDKLARELRDAGRSHDAANVAALRKPTVVVTAVNRAARDRPKAALAAAEAALQVKEAQIGNRTEGFKAALAELESALELLADVAVAHVAPRGKAPSDVMRRRVRDLLRSAVADDEARDALVRGASPRSSRRPASRRSRGWPRRQPDLRGAGRPARAERSGRKRSGASEKRRCARSSTRPSGAWRRPHKRCAQPSARETRPSEPSARCGPSSSGSTRRWVPGQRERRGASRPRAPAGVHGTAALN